MPSTSCAFWNWPTAVPRLQENERLRRENERLTERLRQAETIIDVQKNLRDAGATSAESSRPREDLRQAATELSQTVGVQRACQTLGIPRASVLSKATDCADGQLTVRLRDPGGKDKSVAIAGLTVSYVGAAAPPFAPPEGEARLSGVGPTQNPILAEDVDGDSLVTALDALLLANYLNANPAGGVSPRSSSASGAYLDVNGDGDVTPLDVLLVANHINGRSQPSAEGEARSPLMAKQPTVSPAGLHHAEQGDYIGKAELGFDLEDVLSDIASGVSRGWLG